MTSSRPAVHDDVSRLQRAFARLAEGGDPRGLGRVEVWISQDGLLCVSMGLASNARATSDAERAYALAWYDAFGVRGNHHEGRVVEGA